MERKTVRVSKEPEVYRQEILDTAMSVSIERGYEAATMRDIVTAMYVVPGLCHRYYESKQVPYDTVIGQYIKDTTYPMIELLKETERSLDGSLGKMGQLSIQADEKEKYHHFSYKEENCDLQMFMPIKLCRTIESYTEEKPRITNEKGIIRVKSIPTAAFYMLFGAVPVLENDGLLTAEEVSDTRMIMKCILGL